MFLDDLVEINRLENFHKWFFFREMLFGSNGKWWGKPGTRPANHEGIDICFYKDKSGRRFSLNSSTSVSCMEKGVVVEVHNDDFLGESVFISHDLKDDKDRLLHSVYAHIKPSVNIAPGEKIEKKEVLGHIASLKGRGLKIKEHLHFSILWIPEDFPLTELKWDTMQFDSALLFVDPIPFILNSDSYDLRKERYGNE